MNARNPNQNECQCCGKRIKAGAEVMLEHDQRDWTYHDFGDVPDDQSQGWFPFGASCAKRKRAEAKTKREVAT